MTATEHAAQRALVTASLRLEDGRSARHGVYPARSHPAPAPIMPLIVDEGRQQLEAWLDPWLEAGMPTGLPDSFPDDRRIPAREDRDLWAADDRDFYEPTR